VVGKNYRLQNIQLSKIAIAGISSNLLTSVRLARHSSGAWLAEARRRLASYRPDCGKAEGEASQSPRRRRAF
jgi:hypothetical protein